VHGIFAIQKKQKRCFFVAAYLSAGIAVLSGGWAGPVAAQGTSVAGPPIEEIIVTARKRTEPLLEVPVAVTVFSAATIQDLGIDRLEDAARYTPGFSFASATGRQPASDRPAIRGMTTIRNGIANTSAAATFIDGVYVGGSAQSTEFYNLKRIEVLRGPQAALYGRGTYAGAINYVTRRPTEAFEGEAMVTGADHDTAEVAGWVSGPIVGERLAFFLAAGYRNYGGEYENIRDGSSVGGEESSDLTGKLYWGPVDDLDITLKLGLQETRDDHFAIYLQPQTLNNCCFRSAEAPRAREYFVGEAQSQEQVNLFTDLLNAAGGSGSELSRALAALDIRWVSSGGYTLSSLTGYVGDDVDRGFDASYAAYDPLPFAPGSFTQVDRLEQTDLSQELRFSSPADLPLNWTAGVYYYDGRLEQVLGNHVYEDGSGAIIVMPNASLTRDDIENWAVFGGVDWDIGDRWTAGLELRYAEDEVSVKEFQRDPANTPVEGCDSRNTMCNDTFDSLTPRFTLTYRTDADINLYLNIAKGTKPGDFNSDVPVLADGSADESFRAVAEEKVWNYELGLKGQQQRIGGSIAAYYLDIDDQQLTHVVELSNGGTASIIQNVGRTAVYGLELETGITVSERVHVQATYAYTHAEIRDQISLDEADLRGSDGSLAQTRLLGNVAGNRVPRVPEHSASLVARYEHPLPGFGHWYVNGDYTYEASKFVQEHNLMKTGDQNLVGLRIGLDAGRWDASLWATNIFDDDTPADVLRYFDRRFGTLPSFPQQGPGRASSSPRGFGITLPRGRQIGATLRFRF